MSPSPPPPCGSDVDEQTMDRLSFRANLSIRSRRGPSGPTAASMPTPSPRPIRPRRRPTASIPVDPTAASPVDLSKFSTGGPSYASVVRFGLGILPKPEAQQESGSESELELDSPIHLTIPEYEEYTAPMSPSASPPSPPESDLELDSPRQTIPEYQEFDTPMSPSPPSPPFPTGHTPPPSIDIGPAVLPTFCSDTEDYHSSDDQDDQYFKSLVDNFISATENVWNRKPIVPEEAGNQRQTNKLAVSALEHYNKDGNNKVKYELISAITSCGILDAKGIYGHVNFTAKGDVKNSKEELFFSELRCSYGTWVPTCVLSLDGMKTIDGLCGSKYDKGKNGMFIDAKHCYACERGIKHPKNGALYEIGHIADSDFYHL